MRVRSSVQSALMGVFTRLGGLQESQGFLEMRSCSCAHLRACLSSRKGLATLLGAYPSALMRAMKSLTSAMVTAPSLTSPM